MGRKLKLECEDLQRLIEAVVTSNGTAIDHLTDKACVPESIDDEPYLRLDFAETKKNGGYFMLVVNDTGIQVTYHGHEQGDGQCVLSWYWSLPVKTNNKKGHK